MLRFHDHGAKELGVVGLKNWRVSNFAQQLPTTRNNMQQAEQTAATCNIQQCWEFLTKNVAPVCTWLYSKRLPTTKTVRRQTIFQKSFFICCDKTPLSVSLNTKFYQPSKSLKFSRHSNQYRSDTIPLCSFFKASDYSYSLLTWMAQVS